MIRLEIIQQHAARTPDRPALIDGGRRISWLELADEVARAAGALARLFGGLDSQRSQRIAFLGENSLDVVVLQAAAATLGTAVVGVDHSLAPATVAACLDQVAPAVLAVSPSRLGLARAALACAANQPAMVLCFGPQWAKLIADGSWPPTTGWQRPAFEAFGFTSGTSGTPKLVVRTESFETRRHADVVQTFGITADDVYLSTVPLFHASAAGWARVFLTEGAPVVVAGEGGVTRTAQLAREHGATFTLMVPPVLAEYLERVRTDDARPPLRVIVTGGRHVSPKLAREVTATFGQVLHVYYGTTETGLNTLATPHDLAAVATTVGKPFHGNEIAIVDGHGKRVAAGEPGYVAIASYMLATRFGDGSAPAIELDGARYWVTADTGELDPIGQLRILGRELGGQPLDVVGTEAKLRDVDGVADVAIAIVGASADSAAGKVNASDRHALVAYVPAVPTPAQLDATVMSVASTALPGLAVRCIELDAIPYSPSGKVRPAALLMAAATT